MHGHAEVARVLITQEERLFNVNEADHCGTTPVMDACRFGFSLLVKLLLSEFKAELTQVNKLGMNCLHIASEAGQTEIIKLLVKEYGMDVNIPASPSGLTPLHWAVKVFHLFHIMQ
jgi:ankyrin repeat protein